MSNRVYSLDDAAEFKQTQTRANDAQEAERRVFDAAQDFTAAFIRYGLELYQFELGGHYAWIVDPIASETSEAPVYYRSFDKWLRSQSRLSYSMARLALQVIKRLYMGADVESETLLKIDVGKFVALMPKIEEISAKPVGEIVDIVDILMGTGTKSAKEVADEWRTAQIREWAEFAAGEGVTRQEIIRRREEDEGEWETLYSGPLSLTNDFNIITLRKIGVLTQGDESLYGVGGWIGPLAGMTDAEVRDMETHVVIRRKLKPGQKSETVQLDDGFISAEDLAFLSDVSDNSDRLAKAKETKKDEPAKPDKFSVIEF